MMAAIWSLICEHPLWIGGIVLIAICFIADYFFEKTPWRWK